MSLLSRILNRLLSTRRPKLEREAVELLEQLLDPGKEEVPMPLSHKHSEIQAKASREAGHFLGECERCGLATTVMLAKKTPDSGYEKVCARGCATLTPREDRIIEASSPRAITTRHTIVPPPRPPRKR